MAALKYIWTRKMTFVYMLSILIICQFYLYNVAFGDSLTYFMTIYVDFCFIVFPIFYYYLLNFYHKYSENAFIIIRCEDMIKRKVMDETKLVLSYVIAIYLIMFIPCFNKLDLSIIFYSLDIALLNFSLFYLVTHSIGFFSRYFKFSNVFAFFIALVGVFHVLCIYCGLIDIRPLAGSMSNRHVFSIFALLVGSGVGLLRMRDCYV